jgi:hypothetical protein
MAQGISQYIDEQEQDATQPISNDEAGLRNPVARYVEAYKHLRIRPTASRELEVYDPSKRRAMLTVRPNKRTRASRDGLQNCAIRVMASIASVGLDKTARLFKAQIHTASGVVDYGDPAMKDAPSREPKGDGVLGGGDTSNKGLSYNENGVTSATSKGEDAAQKEPHNTRSAPGLGGKSAAQSGGVQNGADTNMADGPKPPSSSGLDVTDDAGSTSRDKPGKPRSDSLEDVVTTFANESLTSKSAQMDQPPPAAPAAPGEGPEDAPLDEVEARYARFYRAKAAKDTREAMLRFTNRFARCIVVAARRQALNLEENPLKIAMAESLMSDRHISARESYVGMDARTASFVIEQGLDQTSTLDSVRAMLRRTAQIMKMSDESLDQVEQDLDNVGPIAPEAQAMPVDDLAMPVEGQGMDPAMMDPGMGGDMPVEGQDMDPAMMGGDMPVEGQDMDPAMMDPGMGGDMPVEGQDMGGIPGMDPGMGGDMLVEGQDMDPAMMGGDMPVEGQDMDPMAPPAPMNPQASRSAQRRRAALNGNLPVNPSASTAPVAGQASQKRSSVRQALSQTSGAQRHSRIFTG